MSILHSLASVIWVLLAKSGLSITLKDVVHLTHPFLTRRPIDSVRLPLQHQLWQVFSVTSVDMENCVSINHSKQNKSRSKMYYLKTRDLIFHDEKTVTLF